MTRRRETERGGEGEGERGRGGRGEGSSEGGWDGVGELSGTGNCSLLGDDDQVGRKKEQAIYISKQPSLKSHLLSTFYGKSHHFRSPTQFILSPKNKIIILNAMLNAVRVLS